MNEEMRNLIHILENMSVHPDDRAYVPGSEQDPAVKWKKGPNGSLIRKPGDSVAWQVVQQGQDWMIRKVDAEDGSDIPDPYGRAAHAPRGMIMDIKTWRSGAGRMQPRFGYVQNDGTIVFDHQDDAEMALQAYERGLHHQGY